MHPRENSMQPASSAHPASSMAGRADHPYDQAPAEAIDTAAANARQYLEGATTAQVLDHRALFIALPLRGLGAFEIGNGRFLCTYKVPRCLTDGNGSWQAGAISALIDEIGANTIKSVRSHSPGKLLRGEVTVELVVSYFSPAKAGEEVVIEGRVEHGKGRVVATTVEIRKKDGALVAIGRLWMLSVAVRSKI